MILIGRIHLHAHLFGFLAVDACRNRAASSHQTHSGIVAKLRLNFIEHGLLHIDEGDAQVAKHTRQERVSRIARDDDVVAPVALKALGAVIHGNCRIRSAV